MENFTQCSKNENNFRMCILFKTDMEFRVFSEYPGNDDDLEMRDSTEQNSIVMLTHLHSQVKFLAHRVQSSYFGNDTTYCETWVPIANFHVYYSSSRRSSIPRIYIQRSSRASHPPYPGMTTDQFMNE